MAVFHWTINTSIAIPEIAPHTIVNKSGCEVAIAKSQTDEHAIRIIEETNGRLNLTFRAIALPQIMPVVIAARFSDQLRGPFPPSLYARGPSTCHIDSKHMLIIANEQTIAITHGREINSRQPIRKS
ncbi:unannotated protein [freshwater metagenome]|uniref:Unannotated protein n=1 Tax=freshwater metagenome TaxID=449393 RepID=A0A6J7HQ98_9ZZZZ